MRKLKHAHAGARGNALLIVLAAIGLFAALSLVVSQSAQDGGAETETASVAATEIIQYMAAMTSAIDNLKQYNGCSNEEISYQRDWNGTGGVQDGAGDSYNANSPTSPKRCHVFDREGAGFEYRAFGSGDVRLSGTHNFDGFGTGAADLALGIRDGVSREMCQEVNQRLGINGMPSDGNGESGFFRFDGTFAGGPSTVGDSTTPSLTGIRTACYLSGDEYIIYSVLYAR